MSYMRISKNFHPPELPVNTGSFENHSQLARLSVSAIISYQVMPLSGENYDGHDYINAALKQGCAGYFINKEHYNKAQEYYNPTKLILLVDDTQEAYLKLSNYIKKK